MNAKTLVTGLVGLVIGVLGYYLVGRAPGMVNHEVRPTTPTNVALLFRNDVSANSLYAAKSLMPQATRSHVTPADWISLRRWMGDSNGYGFATYEVLTFPNKRTLTLRLNLPTGTRSNLWQVQQIQEGTAIQMHPWSVFVGSKNP